MKTKLFMLLTMMFVSMGAFAQSSAIQGDVNNDGKVDVADIVKVIDIMQQGSGEPGDDSEFYWYAGQTQPTSMNSNPEVDDTNFTVNKWHTLGNATTISKTITGGTSGLDWYVAVPTEVGLKATASDLTTPNPTWENIDTITINGISYTVWRTNSTGGRQAVYMAKIN